MGKSWSPSLRLRASASLSSQLTPCRDDTCDGGEEGSEGFYRMPFTGVLKR